MELKENIDTEALHTPSPHPNTLTKMKAAN
jgi:hypothetical protein